MHRWWKSAARLGIASATMLGSTSIGLVGCDAFSLNAGTGYMDYVRDHIAVEEEGGGDEEVSRLRREGYNRLCLISGSNGRELSEEISEALKVPLAEAKVSKFADGEINVQLQSNIRGADVYIVQSTSPPVNDSVMELLLLISAARRASAKSVTAVVPYYGYKRDVGTPDTSAESYMLEGQEVQRGEAGNLEYDVAIPVAAADLAILYEAMGVDQLISVDLQPPGHGEIEGFFTSAVTVENLRTTAVAVSYLANQKLHKPCVVAPNEACVELAHDLREGLRRTLRRRGVPSHESEVSLALLVEKGPSRGTDRYLHRPRRKSKDDEDNRGTLLLGSVKDRDVIIVDDLVDSAASLVARTKFLLEQGARSVRAFSTHGLFTNRAMELISLSDLKEMIVTNTCPLRADQEVSSKVVQLSVGKVLASAVLRCHNRQSLQDLRVYCRDNVRPRYSSQE